MALRKLGDSVYLYPGSPSTLVKVIEGGAVIVDPGHGSGRHKDLRREVRKLGVKIAAQLATHGHADHIAVAPRINAPLFIHRFEFSIAESPLNRELLTFGSKAPEGFLAYQFPEEVKVHAVFEWGDEPFGLKAVKLNGHSPGMTGFLDGENGLVYAGDAFFGERVIEAVGLPYLVDPELFKASIKELQNYAEKGFLLIPSHGKTVKGEEAIELLNFNLGRVEEMESIILELLKTPMSIDELALRIMEHYGVKPTPQKLALNLVPLRAFIAQLYNEGRVEALVEKGLKWRVRGN
ncbi:MBL fold metallo-hydrolase [Thermococcus thioreducens]|uniref:Glyoxylase, beta-lactamase superfamily II n=1 Tax=Thermococcus thioreducens TaxID=277988 RepID=A0A0Q2M3E3_9EURY|nr:MBL fold metallo-hydrolase [Thermococcus thioreducens]ASJ12549.1 Zn-dependent hydrolase [Thermococcus thioreducens]KQH82450.1 Zn-dependent hydrolase [Thermococcus thioreducens]SEV88926.1 Glyoxylase, beta-lactamase superfamily II [Thermococcus thioreducens]